MSPCFFFQAEDGIRDYKVTGVQTCALPIWSATSRRPRGRGRPGRAPRARQRPGRGRRAPGRSRSAPPPGRPRGRKIGRASCREREEISVEDGWLQQKEKEQSGYREQATSRG